jgi:hydantoinase/carbamoylase family amidase
LTHTGRSLGLHEAIESLARFNRAPELGGITREVYSPEYQQALELVDAYMRDRGLVTRIDPAGNLIGRLAGAAPELPRVLTGSHIDTTLNAGRYDGVVGVLGGAEALGRIAASDIQPRRTLEVIAFAGEEPRFGMGCIGSRLMTGRLGREDLERLRDRDGITVAEAMRAAGLDPDRAPDARVDPGELHAILELHVEQGGRLESEELPLGVVDKIAAAHDLQITITGRAVHSGATPMHLRHDALLGAAEATIAVERIANASASGSTVGTVGVLSASPGAANVVPGIATMVVDIRDSDAAARNWAVSEFLGEVRSICARRGLGLDVKVIQDNLPSTCDPLVIEAVRAGCQAVGEPYLVMASGAYHDCMSFSPEVPIGMLFVPSAEGISHSPDEFTAPEHIDLGVDVLTDALRRLAQ